MIKMALVSLTYSSEMMLEALIGRWQFLMTGTDMWCMRTRPYSSTGMSLEPTLKSIQHLITREMFEAAMNLGWVVVTGFVG